MAGLRFHDHVLIQSYNNVSVIEKRYQVSAKMGEFELRARVLGRLLVNQTLSEASLVM